MAIKDISRLSGYGVSTVSRALNGHPDISEETKKKINEIVKKYNYVPNANARQLKQNVSKNILIIVKGSFNLFFSTIIEHIQVATDKAGISAIVHYIDEDDNEVKMAHRLCIEQKPIGIIFLAGNINFFKDGFDGIKIPCVLSTTYAKELEFANLSSVCVDDTGGAEKAIDHFFDSGHKNIGIISGEFEKANAALLRLDGCKKSFNKHNANFDSDSYVESKFSISAAYEATKELIAKNNDITAIFAMSDIMGMGAIRALNDLGKKVPEDVSVIGFDGIELASYYTPRLTSISQPEKDIAAISIKLLMDMIEKNKPASHVLLEATLQEGDSVKRFK